MGELAQGSCVQTVGCGQGRLETGKYLGVHRLAEPSGAGRRRELLGAPFAVCRKLYEMKCCFIEWLLSYPRLRGAPRPAPHLP